MIGDFFMDYIFNGVVQFCDGNWNFDMVFYGVYFCFDDEWVCIVVNDDRCWQVLVRIMMFLGLENDS